MVGDLANCGLRERAIYYLTDEDICTINMRHYEAILCFTER
jgi:hypothetical protein